MKMEEIHPKDKSGFLRFITNLIKELAEEHKLYKIEDSLPAEVLELFRKEIENSRYGFNKWKEFILIIGDKEFAEIILDRLNAYRKRKVTLKQIDFYTGMYRDLEGKECKMPKDFLEFQYKISKLKEDYLQRGPATETQIKAVKKQWYQKTGQSLSLPNVITRGFVSNTFEQLDSWPYCKIKKVNPIIEWDEQKNKFKLSITFKVGRMSYGALYHRYTDSPIWMHSSIVHQTDGKCAFCSKVINVAENPTDRCDKVGGYKLIEYLQENFKVLDR